jgi:hypothetical protein
MDAMPRLLLLPLLVALAALALPARGQFFFPDGTDAPHYVPNVPGTPNGRFYVGEFTGDAKCHFRYDVPPGKTVRKNEVFNIGDPERLGGPLIAAIAQL